MEELQLKSASVLTPNGVGVKVTACPHRNGNPDHVFYEVWFNWEGGTLRTSTVIHNEDTRDAVFEFLELLTGIAHDETLAEILDKYDWHSA